MQFVNAEVAAEFDRWAREIGDEPPIGRFSVCTLEVLRAHFLLADYFRSKGEGVGGIGPRSTHLLHSAVSRQWVSFGGNTKWRDLTDVCATLFFGLIRNHPFHDANKRTALLSVLYQLQCHDRIPSSSAASFEELTERVAERSLSQYKTFESCEDLDDPEVRYISRFFRRNTREIDKRRYIVTYRQLDRLLRTYDARLENPTQNKIDVVKDSFEIVFFKKKTVSRRVLQIGFHDWGTEVNGSDVDAVRKALNLTHKQGIDSKVFFYGLDPLESLLAEYRGPLERLAFK